MVELFAAALFRAVAGCVTTRSPALASRGTPHAGNGWTNLTGLSPDWPRLARLWFEPPWGISATPLVAALRSPALRQHAPSRLAVAAGRSPQQTEKGVSLSPRAFAGSHRIERPDYFSRWSRERLLGRASTNPDEPLSRHPASLGSTSRGWLVRTLSRLVKSVYRVTSPVLEDVRRSFSVPDDRRAT